ncbi:MAG TPA: hypothetical protein VNQ80_10260 [Parapedobacter sp.]|nr:hypothetical protein [Parapedobacter sp.]
MLDDFFVSTTINSIDMEFLVRNHSARRQNTVVDVVVTDTEGKVFLRLPQNKIALNVGDSTKVSLKKTQLKPQLWSPEHPVLYNLEISLKSGKQEILREVRRIGFKTFEVRGHLFYLNGNPYYLRALSQWPVSRVVDEHGKRAPEVWTDEGFVKRFFEKAKELNINAGRIGDNDLWVKYADEMGFLNIAGSYSGAGATENRVFKSNRDNFTPKIRKLRNHASTAIYTLANEISWGRNPDFLELAVENYEFAKTLDPTHPIIANAGFGRGKVGDIEDEHDYTAWYGGSVLDMDKYEREAFYQKGGGVNQPVTFTECVGTYTGERTGRFHLWYNKGMSNALRHVGRGGQHPDDPQWYQRVVTKEMMEGMRRARGMESRVAGSFPYSDFWKWDVPNKSFSTKPATEVIKQVYSPVLLSLKSWKRHAFGGEKIEGMLYVIHDDVELPVLNNATVTISLVQNGNVLSKMDTTVPSVNYYSTVTIPVSLKIPETIVAGPARVIMELHHDQARSTPNEMDVFIAPRDFANSRSSEPVTLYDPEGKTADAMESIGLDVNRITNLQLGTGTGLVIGSETLSTLSDTQIQDVLSFVGDGGRVLVLKQEGKHLKSSALVPHGVTTQKYNSLFVNTERPGLLDKGLVNRDFFLWNPLEGSSGFPVTEVFDIQPAALHHTSVLANCGHMLQYQVVLEHFKGKGSIIFSQFELVGRVQDDPIAARVLGNLIDYLQTANHTIGPQLTTDVLFGDLDSEAGLFPASLKQGIMINGHNYGKVSWEKYGWPEGRRILGEQKIINGLGYTGTVDPVDTAKGFFYMRAPAGAGSFYLEVKNPVERPLWFKVYLNDEPAGEVVIVEPNTVKKFGPWKLPANRGEVKVTIESQADLHALKREKPIIEELVFQKMLFD